MTHTTNIRNLRIHINLERPIIESDLELRYTLVDTIEDRGIGEVWDEGAGDQYMEVNVELEPNDSNIYYVTPQSSDH